MFRSCLMWRTARDRWKMKELKTASKLTSVNKFKIGKIMLFQPYFIVYYDDHWIVSLGAGVTCSSLVIDTAGVPKSTLVCQCVCQYVCQ